MIQDIDNINVSIQSDDSINVTIDNDNSISVTEGTPTDISEIMHNEEIRQENETQRIANEEDREDYINDLKQRVLDGEFNGQDGEPGPQGPQGETGPQGPKGDKGDTGNTGPKGDTGEQGPQGIQGIQGEQGPAGQDGTDGEDGISPTVTMTKQGKVTTLTITDKNGEHTTEIRDGNDGSGTGDMLKATYDTNDNGVVDNAEKVNNHTVETDVPANAVFTDTTYTAGTGIDITNNVISSTQSSAEWGNITGTLSDQTDLKNALDGKQDKIDSTHKLTSDLVDDTNQNNKFLTEGSQQIEGTKTFTSLPQFAFSTEPTLDNELTTKAYVDNFEYQKRTLPVASSYYYNDIFQYVGTTNINYTKGYFYRCTRSGTSGEGYQYEWTRIDVQPGFSGDYNDLTNKPTIPDELADLSDDSTHRLVTDTEKTTWNGKQNAINSSNKLSADLINDSSTTNKFVTLTQKAFWNDKQEPLVSGTNIKTINNTSILGSGNLDVGADIPQQDSAPSNPQEDDLWIDTDDNTNLVNIDSAISTTSTNPIENQAITNFILDNITSVLNNIKTYSINETEIGYWINGKPLYRKIFTGTLADGDATIDMSSLNIGILVNSYGRCGAVDTYRPLNFYLSGYFVSTRYAYGTMYIAASSTYAGEPFELVVEYTKSTD